MGAAIMDEQQIPDRIVLDIPLTPEQQVAITTLGVRTELLEALQREAQSTIDSIVLRAVQAQKKITIDRYKAEQQKGILCFDCHGNFVMFLPAKHSREQMILYITNRHLVRSEETLS